MLHRSAVFLIVFLVVHMLGNLTFLISDDAFNAYGYKLEALRPATTAIEVLSPTCAVVVAGYSAVLSGSCTSSLPQWCMPRQHSHQPTKSGLPC